MVIKPEQTLVLMCGLPGSGKSTLAQTIHSHHPEMVLIASDSIREELYGDEANQGDPNEVFGEVNRRIREAIDAGRSVIYDATNAYPWSRKRILDLLPQTGDITVQFWVVETPLDTCLTRNAARTRVVPEAVIRKMAKCFRRPTRNEWTHGPCVVVRKTHTV